MSFDQNDLDKLEAFKAAIVAEVLVSLEDKFSLVHQKLSLVNNNIINWLQMNIGPDTNRLC